MMIRILDCRTLGEFRLELGFSNGERGIFDARVLLSRDGPLLEPLRSQAYFDRVFLDAGALCWPNGLELSPQRVYEDTRIIEAA